MKIVLWFFSFLTVSLAFADDGKPFVYNENGKKDPFAPLVSTTGVVMTYDSEISSSDMVLEGVVADATGHNLAILNGKIVKTGDKISSYIVGTISVDQIELINGQEHLTVKIKKGGV